MHGKGGAYAHGDQMGEKANQMSREGGGICHYGNRRLPVDKHPLRLIG